MHLPSSTENRGVPLGFLVWLQPPATASPRHIVTQDLHQSIGDDGRVAFLVRPHARDADTQKNMAVTRTAQAGFGRFGATCRQ